MISARLVSDFRSGPYMGSHYKALLPQLAVSSIIRGRYAIKRRLNHPRLSADLKHSHKHIFLRDAAIDSSLALT